MSMAVVGLDHIHAAGFLESLTQGQRDFDVAAIVEPSAPLMETVPPPLRSVPRYDTIDALLAQGRPTAALVTLPNKDAPRAIAQLAEAGVHVLVDKPGARTAAEAAAAFGAARRAGVVAGTGLGQRLNPAFRHVRDRFRRGELGELRSVDCVYVTADPFLRGPGHYLFDKETSGGGMLHWLGIHALDQFTWVTGRRVRTVQAQLATVTGAPIDVEDVATVTLTFDNGARGLLHCGYVLHQPGNEVRFGFHGTKGSAIVALEDGRWTVRYLWPGGRETCWVTEESLRFRLDHPPGYGWTLLADFAAAVRAGRDPIAPGEAIVDVLRLVEKAYESAALGAPVDVEGP